MNKLTDKELVLFLEKITNWKGQGLTQIDILAKLEMDKSTFNYRLEKLGVKWKSINPILAKKTIVIPINLKKSDKSNNSKSNKVGNKSKVKNNQQSGNNNNSQGDQSYKEISEDTLKEYVLDLANNGEPDVRVAQMMFNLLREKKEIVQDKNSSLEMDKAKVMELMNQD